MIVNNFRIDTVCFARPPARCALHKFSAGSRWAEYNEAGCSGSIAAAVHARSTRDLWNSKSAPSIPQSRSRDSTVNFANALGVWFRCSQTDRRRKHRARERERERERARWEIPKSVHDPAAMGHRLSFVCRPNVCASYVAACQTAMSDNTKPYTACGFPSYSAISSNNQFAE